MTLADDEDLSVSEILRRLVDARRSDLRVRLDGPQRNDAVDAPLPRATQILACLIDAAGLRDAVAVADRSFQRQKAGERTALVEDATIRALARLFIDAARPGLLAQGLDATAMQLYLVEQITAACAAWDRVANAARETLVPRAARHAALRLVMLELAVRRAAISRLICANSCPPWFAFDRHPFNAALRQALAHNRIELEALRRELERADGFSLRTFESWRHEGKPASLEGIDAIVMAITKLSRRRPNQRATTQHLVSMFRCARIAVLVRRALDEALGAPAVVDLFAGHQRVAECVFDTLNSESTLAIAAASAVLTTSPTETIASLRRVAAFDPDTRQLLDPGSEWLELGLRKTDTAEERAAVAKLAELFRVAPFEERLQRVRALLLVGMSHPEARAQFMPELERGALADLLCNGPRARAFAFLFENLSRRLPWRGVTSDLRDLAVDPIDHLLELIARGDVLAMIPHLVAARGLDASHIQARDLITDLHSFDVEKSS